MKKVHTALFLLTLFLGIASLYGNTIYVPDDYSTIQEAIDAANPGDIVAVKGGVYNERLFINKSITLRSENGPENSIIDGNGQGYVITIYADGVTIEGFTIRNSRGSPYAGINVNSDNNIIRNNNISNNGYGIYLAFSSNNSIITNNNIVSNNGDGIHMDSSSNNNIITNNNISNNNGNGIYLDSSSNNNSIINNKVSNNKMDGIYLKYSRNSSSGDNNITKNNISNNRYGIWFMYSGNNSITENNISNNVYGIMMENSRNNLITNNSIASNKWDGIHLFKSSNNNNIIDNNISNNMRDGIHLEYLSNNNSIIGNNIFNNKKDGIYLYNSYESSNSNSIIDNNISNNKKYGIELWYSSNNSIINNNISNNDDGIYLYNLRNNSIINNNISNNTNGIYLYSSSYNSIIDNNIALNDDGIVLRHSNNNIITSNNITSNNRCGIHLDYTDYSKNNTVYLNNFINNGNMVLINVYSHYSTNLWNSPEEITYIYNGNKYTNYLGNYWDDYNGSDTNGDGIGDVPYKLNEYNIDYYPLIKIVDHYRIGTSSTTNMVASDIKSEKIRNFIYRAKLIVSSEIDIHFSARYLKTGIGPINIPFKINEDCILIGGPVANPTVEKYIENFPVKVTNKYPGKHKGVIEKIRINGHTVILLAGSDRWGTKAAVEYFKTLENLPDEPIFVEWKDGIAVKIERP